MRTAETRTHTAREVAVTTDKSGRTSAGIQMEWPPRSGRVETFPEIDRVEWFKLNRARRKLKAAQVPFLDRLQAANRSVIQ
jgi:predicted NUDIX family NTP pyrophosphohydrolase